MERKPFTFEYCIDYEGYEHVEVSIDSDDYTSYIKQLANNEGSMIVYVSPSVETLGAEGYDIYLKEKARLAELSAKRRAAALKGVATRKAKNEKRETVSSVRS
jgi:hypothetical protein